MSAGGSSPGRSSPGSSGYVSRRGGVKKIRKPPPVSVSVGRSVASSGRRTPTGAAEGRRSPVAVRMSAATRKRKGSESTARSRGRATPKGKLKPVKGPGGSSLRKTKSTPALQKGALAEKYEIQKKLGKGSFGVVRKVICKATGKEYAAKIISKRHLSKAEKNELQLEVSIMRSLRHENVCRMYELMDTPRHMYIVMELLTGGELFERIIAVHHFSEAQASGITQQIARGLHYMHSNYVVHRDLKPENVVFQSEKTMVVKITDFGLARSFRRGVRGKQPMETTCGTPGYCAPEILKLVKYDEMCDMWSLGVMTYIMLCGYPPFPTGGNVKVMYRKIKRGEYSFPDKGWSAVSELAKDCVRGMLTVEPSDRMTAAELLEHPWIQKKHAVDASAERNLMTDAFGKRLKIYNHRKKLRRGVDLIIMLNRMIRAAGLEQRAKDNRALFRRTIKRVRAETGNENPDLELVARLTLKEITETARKKRAAISRSQDYRRRSFDARRRLRDATRRRSADPRGTSKPSASGRSRVVSAVI